MPEISPQLRRGLVALAAVLVFAGAVGAAMLANNDDKPEVIAGAGATTTLVDGSPSETTSADGAGKTASSVTTRNGSSGSGARPSGPPTSGRSPGTTRGGVAEEGCSTGPVGVGAATADPGPAKPPQPGKYTYDSVTTGDFEDPCKAKVTKIEAGSDGNGVVRRVSTRESPQGARSTHEAWAADAVRLERLVITGPFGTIDCDWNPDPTILVFPLSTGKTWSGDSSCDASAGGVPFKLRAQGNAKVSGTKSVTVGGTKINVWVIESTIKITSTGAVNDTSEEKGVTYFDPARGIDVYEKSSTETSRGDVTTERRLRSLSAT